VQQPEAGELRFCPGCGKPILGQHADPRCRLHPVSVRLSGFQRDALDEFVATGAFASLSHVVRLAVQQFVDDRSPPKLFKPDPDGGTERVAVYLPSSIVRHIERQSPNKSDYVRQCVLDALTRERGPGG